VVQEVQRALRRFILTGTPGSGKTAILRQLELDGFAVVEEAATDLIALEQAKGIEEPWTGDPTFIDNIVALQRRRRLVGGRLAGRDEVQFHDRSAFCSAALAEFLGEELSDDVLAELDELKRTAFYEKRVFFVRNLGFVQPTAARRISFENAQRFELVHAKTYLDHGFELVPIAAASVLDRAAAIRRAL
jgi:predicted ATPase